MPPARKKRRVGSARGVSATSTSVASTAELGSEVDIKGDGDGGGAEEEHGGSEMGVDETLREGDRTEIGQEGGGGTVEAEEAETEEEKKKERESRERIYAEFAEEYYDIVEQLPLEINRNFTLIAEWEAALQEGENKLRERLLEYVRLVAPRGAPPADGVAAAADAEAPAAANDATRVDTPMTNGASEVAEDDEATVAAQLLALAAGPSSAVADPKVNGHTNGGAKASEVGLDEREQKRRKLMLEIAGLMDSAVKRGQDKVNLATTVYDWVDRHINRLDADLLKFEDATVLGLRPGTLPSHDAPSAAHFVADNPPSARRLRLTGAFANASSSGGQPSRSGAVTNRARDKKRARDRSAGLVGEKSKKGRSASPDKHGSAAAGGPSGGGGSRAARPLPPARAAVSEDMAVDPNEPRYCYCNQVSFGTMVGCDNPDCEREWFHLSCAGLTAPPANKWFCRDCAPRKH